MWATKQPNGKIKFRERYTDPLTGNKNGTVSVVMDKDTAATRKLALQILNQRIDEKLDGRSEVSSDSDTLQDLVDAYNAEAERTLKATTASRNAYSARGMLKILGPDTLLSKLNAKYIRDKYYALDEDNSRINERIKRMKVILRWGYRNDYLSDISFLDKVQPLPDIPYREKIEDKFLERDDLRKLLDNMHVAKWKLLTQFLALSGLRIGEAAALDVNDVDFDNRLIHVTKNFDPIHRIVTTPKTDSSCRDVYMQDELADCCRQVNLYMKRRQFMDGYRSQVFFQGEGGEHLRYDAYRKYLRETAESVLGRTKVTPHILRHTHTCLLAESGVPLETISRRLGHEDSEITRKIYLHITERMKEQDNERIAAVKIL